jgi:hypothetical protein
MCDQGARCEASQKARPAASLSAAFRSSVARVIAQPARRLARAPPSASQGRLLCESSLLSTKNSSRQRASHGRRDALLADEPRDLRGSAFS